MASLISAVSGDSRLQKMSDSFFLRVITFVFAEAAWPAHSRPARLQVGSNMQQTATAAILDLPPSVLAGQVSPDPWRELGHYLGRTR